VLAPLDWIAANETLLSGLAALVVVIGVTFSPLGSLIRGAISRRSDKTINDRLAEVAKANPNGVGGVAETHLDKPTIAVLPFENLSGDAEQEYFTDGIAEDIIVALSKLHSLFVVARNTSFAYRGHKGEDANFGKLLGVRYLVQGSVRKSGQNARITARLVDTESDEQLWAESYDRELNDIFSVQDEITAKIISILPSRIEAADLKRISNKPTSNLAAYEYLLRGKYHHHQRTRADNDLAYNMLERAIEEDPSYAQAYAWRACVIGQAMVRGYRDDIAVDQELMNSLQTALALDKDDFECHRVLSAVYLIRQQFDRAEFHAKRAYELNCNDPRVISQFGELLALTGQAEAGVEKLELALRLDPYRPDDRLMHLGFAQFVAGRYRDAIVTLKKIATLEAKHHAYLAASYAKLDDMENARQQAGDVRRLAPEFSAAEFTKQVLYKNESDRSHHIEALEKSGL
jgi:adenylate cyclase